jgi:hypothetical protein
MNRPLLEKDIKKMVRSELKKLGIVSATELPTPESTGWYYMPVQRGMGMSKIADFVGQYKGRFFAIETKAPGKECTGLQAFIGKNINATGGFWCVVDNEETMKVFLGWATC